MNRERYLQIKLKYKHSEKGIYSTLKCGAKRRNIPMGMTRDEFVEWYKKQKQVCIYCKRSVDEIREKLDFLAKRMKRMTIDRLDNSAGYYFDNMGLCCYRCNAIKGDFFTKDEMLKIGKIIHDKKS